jgi:hypothetical protein
MSAHVICIPVHKDADGEKDHGPQQNIGHQLCLGFPAGQPPGEGIRHRDADDENEKWEDQIRDRLAIPSDMRKGRIRIARLARQVDDGHEDKRHAAKDVQ